MSGNSESVTMIEKVARALCSMQESPPLNPDHIYKGRPIWQEWEHEARAAIEAMREPTREMLNSGDEMMPQFSEEDKNLTGFDVSREVWQAMIDTALGEDHP